MSNSESAGLLAVLLGMGIAFILVILALLVLLIIAQWKLFTKAGEEGWKAIIPVYNSYVLFKLVWNTTNFWIYLALSIVYSIFNSLYSSSDGNIFLSLLAIAAGIALFVWYVRLQLNTAKAYGKGIGFGIGLILLPNIFLLILGFGDSRYVGPQD